MRVETSPWEYGGIDKDEEDSREAALTTSLLTRRQGKFRTPLQ